MAFDVENEAEGLYIRRAIGKKMVKVYKSFQLRLVHTNGFEGT